MNIWKISIKNLKNKAFYTGLSIIILALSITLLLGIKQIQQSFKYQTENNLGNIDMVIGAKGSPLQLILASVLHIDNPTGNISYTEAKTLAKNRLIKSAIPISYGDNYKGYRIVGTNNNFYTLYNAELNNGRFANTAMEVVIGATIANKLNLKLGDTFKSAHGLIDNTVDVHDNELTVVGILKPTEKVIDRLIITPLETIWDVHNHNDEVHNENDENEHNHDEDAHKTEEEHTHEHTHNDTHEHEEHHNIEKHSDNHEEDHAHENKQITALLVTFRNPMGLLTLPRKINDTSNLQAALPKYELDRLYEFTSIGFKTITWIAYLILIISGITIFINLYKMVKERAYDLALLRSYGASNFQLIKMVFYEGFIAAFLAFILGLTIVKIGTYALIKFSNLGMKAHIIQPLNIQDGIQIAVLVFIMVTLSIAFAIYPILKMNISTILSNEK
ncbi:ABC transporter permease [Seonamhaeicola algicola]|uniref:ABC transporter permease n=2 Tax=Seonamhaeicola TaxID=1649495 RepID=A0A5C7AUN2_9FLAO|nr:ABC transporter permease [Seonamhaeicola algicola]TXE11824.1 ABC transporter permease [Seonamhaeicola algicola]